jgi:hypothetical protein
MKTTKEYSQPQLIAVGDAVQATLGQKRVTPRRESTPGRWIRRHH